MQNEIVPDNIQSKRPAWIARAQHNTAKLVRHVSYFLLLLLTPSRHPKFSRSLYLPAISSKTDLKSIIYSLLGIPFRAKVDLAELPKSLFPEVTGVEKHMQIKYSLSCTVKLLSISPILKNYFHFKWVVFIYKGPNVWVLNWLEE